MKIGGNKTAQRNLLCGQVKLVCLSFLAVFLLPYAVTKSSHIYIKYLVWTDTYFVLKELVESDKSWF